jgi:hypothetical protein
VELRDFLRTMSGLDQGGLLELGAEPSPAEAADREAARTAAREAVARRGLGRELEDVAAEILRWSTVGGAGSGVYSFASAPGDLLLADLRRQAVPALMDVAVAFVLGDALDPSTRETLLARWQGVTGTDA